MSTIDSKPLATSGQLPVNGETALDILVNDHLTIKQLLSELVAAGEQTARAQTLERLTAILTVHNATEESLVYPALAVIAGKKMEAGKLYHETAAADMLMFELDTMAKTGDDAKFQPNAKALQAAILEHIDDEETKAFPRVRDSAEPAQLQLLTTNVRQFRDSLRFETSR